jgi:predicted nucleic acid-binding protein
VAIVTDTRSSVWITRGDLRRDHLYRDDGRLPVFVDTNVLVAASVTAHPSHGVASAYLARLAADGAPACVSGQVCREFLVVLTRQPVEGRAFTVDEALAALETWRSGCAVLDEDDAVLAELLALIRRPTMRRGNRATARTSSPRCARTESTQLPNA